jgi:hypothetical protein
MTTHKMRLEKLEQRAVDQTAVEITEIEIHKHYEDGEEVIEYLQIAQLDQDGNEVVRALLPKNGRETDPAERD